MSRLTYLRKSAPSLVFASDSTMRMRLHLCHVSNCTLRGGKLAQPTDLLRENRYDLGIECTMVWCAACGVGQTVPEMSTEELLNLYRQ